MVMVICLALPEGQSVGGTGQGGVHSAHRSQLSPTALLERGSNGGGTLRTGGPGLGGAGTGLGGAGMRGAEEALKVERGGVPPRSGVEGGEAAGEGEADGEVKVEAEGVMAAHKLCRDQEGEGEGEGVLLQAVRRPSV